MIRRPPSSTLFPSTPLSRSAFEPQGARAADRGELEHPARRQHLGAQPWLLDEGGDRKSTRLNSSHLVISYAVFCLKKKTTAATRPIHSSRLSTLNSYHSLTM